MAVVGKQSKEIEGTTYTTEIFPATAGVDLGQWLAKVFGDALLALFVSLPDDEADGLVEDIKNGALGNDVMAPILAALVGVCKTADPGELSSLAKALLARTEFVPAEGQKAVPVALYFDEHFAGRYMHAGQVCLWVMRASFVRP